MTEPYGYDDDQLDEPDDGTDDGTPLVRQLRNQLREAKKQAKTNHEKAERAATLERENLLLRVGGEFTERQQKALFASIDGDPTPDSVREAAIELGFMKAPENTPEQQEAAALQRMSTASSGDADSIESDPVARLQRAADEGGYEGLIAQIQRDGHNVQPAG